jgi:glycosyltransferase involved in cell wall biosynthesis
MKRVLALSRGPGGAERWAKSLPPLLEVHGIELVVDRVSWIPDATGWRNDRPASKRLKEALRGFDAAIGIGMRAAWACSEALYLRFPWAYFAYDLPRTCHGQLIDRLNAARLGVCSSRAVRQSLAGAEALHLSVCAPGAAACLPDDGLRQRLGLEPGSPLIFMGGEPERDSGADLLEAALPEAWAQSPSAAAVIAPAAEPGWAEIHRRGSAAVRMPFSPRDEEAAAACADIVVEAGPRRGFSLTAARAMQSGRCVLLRRAGGLSEMAVDGQSGFFFEDDLGAKLAACLASEEGRQAAAAGARSRAEERFDPAAQARQLAQRLNEAFG